MADTNKFEVGDRVRVKGYMRQRKTGIAHIPAPNSAYVVKEINPIVVSFGDGEWDVCPFQLVRLIKKPKERIWVNRHMTGGKDEWVNSYLTEAEAAEHAKTYEHTVIERCIPFIRERSGK